MNTLKYIYTYALTAFGLVTILISTSIILVNLISLPYFSGYRESFDSYSQNLRNECQGLLDFVPISAPQPITKPYARLSTDECKVLVQDRESVRTAYNDMIAENRDQEKRDEVNRILHALPWIMVMTPLFLIFNGMRRKLEEKK